MVGAYHTATPSAPGIELERLRQALDVVAPTKVFRAVVDGLVAEGRLERRGGSIAVAGHRQSMSSEGERMAELVLETLRGSGAMPPTLAELQARHGSAGDLQQLLGVLVGRGLVVKVSSDLYFTTEALAAIRAQLTAYLGAHERITAAEFRDLISASRKYSIPLLDFFDRSGLTIRIGDCRQLRS
jgi:selenocysteine-specific elongation factor